MTIEVEDKRRFVLALTFLARECRKELTDTHFALYSRAIAPVGWKAATKAIERLCMRRRDRDPMPTPRELWEETHVGTGSGLTPDEVASVIVGAVRRFGYPNPREAEKAIGFVGWEIVKREGGWGRVCGELTTFNIDRTRQHWARMAEAIMARRGDEELGRLLGSEARPQLPED